LGSPSFFRPRYSGANLGKEGQAPNCVIYLR
jgi:hypothetical protein